MKLYLISAIFVSGVMYADVVIDASNGNGAFVSTATKVNASIKEWNADSGVWIDVSNSNLTEGPFGEDNIAESHCVQLHANQGEVLTSGSDITLNQGDPIHLSVDYKISGAGTDPEFKISLWDVSAKKELMVLGAIHSAIPQPTFKQVSFSTKSTVATKSARLRFTLANANGSGKDVTIDRVYLNAGKLTNDIPTGPIEYAHTQVLRKADTDAQIIEKAAKTLPRKKQVDWQRLEETYFIHFGLNSFTGVEWGTGKESPSIFNPTALDAKQWVREIKNAGGKMLMLVVKHHEGFCMWPSKYTQHSVASSPWLEGKGDLARMVSDACRAENIKFGVYLSPADLFQIESKPGFGSGFYGNGSKAQVSTIPTDPQSFSNAPDKGRAAPNGKPTFKYTVDDYNRYFLNQLYELLTEYGPVEEVWFDGASPKQTNPPQLYNRDVWFELISSLCPNALIAIKGPDVRWVGNESGVARESEWSPLPIPKAPEVYDWGDMRGELGERKKLVRGTYLTWYPAETDVPLLHGWFWGPKKSPRTTAELINIYYTSVGRNSNMLLNLSPDNRGLIPENQLNPLRAMGKVVRQTFATNLAANGILKASSVNPKHPESLAMDKDLDSWWEPEAGQQTAELVLTLPNVVTFDVISLQEAIAQRGQRIESFGVEGYVSGAWQSLVTATTVGHKRLLRLKAPVSTDQVRIKISGSRLEPSLASIGLFKQADLVEEPKITRDNNGMVTLTAASTEVIHYTMDGKDPDVQSPIYQAPFQLGLGGDIKALAVRANGSKSLVASQEYGIAPVGWNVTATSSPQTANLSIDGNTSTCWVADGNSQPHGLVVDLGISRWISGLTYLPRQDGQKVGICKSYKLAVSADGNQWTDITDGTFDNIKNNPMMQTVRLAKPVNVRFVRFLSTAEVDGANAFTVAELGILSAPTQVKKLKRK